MTDKRSEQKTELRSRFDSLDTAALEELLRQDYLLPDEGYDPDAALAIARTLAERSEQDAAPDAAWRSLQRDYIPAVDLSDLPEMAPEGNVRQQKRKRALTRRSKSLIAAAAAVLLIVGIASSASGFRFFDWIVKWTDSEMGLYTPEQPLMESQSYPEVLHDLLDTMVLNGFPETLIPFYIPEGYSPGSVACYESFEKPHILCHLKSDDGSRDIVLSYLVRDDTPIVGSYEKDPGPPEIYKTKNNVFSISTNMGDYFTVWQYENIECFIGGVSTREEMIKIIDSLDQP